MKKLPKLSKRETDVAEAMLEGCKNREIAIRLDIDQKTVSTYINRLKRKLYVDLSMNAYFTVVTYLGYRENLRLEEAGVEYVESVK